MIRDDEFYTDIGTKNTIFFLCVGGDFRRDLVFPKSSFDIAKLYRYKPLDSKAIGVQ